MVAHVAILSNPQDQTQRRKGDSDRQPTNMTRYVQGPAESGPGRVGSDHAALPDELVQVLVPKVRRLVSEVSAHGQNHVVARVKLGLRLGVVEEVSGLEGQGHGHRGRGQG